MSLIQKFYCEICGAEKRDVNNWALAEVTEAGVLVSPWREDRAKSSAVRHICGEAHAQVFVSRYLAAPSSFKTGAPGLNAADNDLTAVQTHLVNKVLQQPSDLSAESEEIFDLLAAAEAALKGRITIDALTSDHFDA
jgi:hypothetical protein